VLWTFGLAFGQDVRALGVATSWKLGGIFVFSFLFSRCLYEFRDRKEFNLCFT